MSLDVKDLNKIPKIEFRIAEKLRRILHLDSQPERLNEEDRESDMRQSEPSNERDGV